MHCSYYPAGFPTQCNKSAQNVTINGIERQYCIRHEIEARCSNLTAEVAELKAMRLLSLLEVLEYSPVRYLRAVAEHLNVPTRYDGKSLKPKNVLAAALYEYFRKPQVAV